MSDWREGFNRAALDHMVLNGGMANVESRSWGYESLDVYEPWRKTPAETLEHLVECGLDYAKSGNVRPAEWSVFQDTYTENSEHVGLLGHVVCRCGKIDAQFVIEGSFGDVLTGILLGGN